MKFWWFLFFVFLSMCFVLGFVLIRGEDGQLHGMNHPTKDFISIGGAAKERTGDLIWFGLSFGALQLVAFVSMLKLGFSNPEKDKSAIYTILIGGGAVYLILFATIFFLYSGEISEAGVTTLPWSAWFAIFVFWPFPLLFIAIYAFSFHKFFCNDSDQI